MNHTKASLLKAAEMMKSKTIHHTQLYQKGDLSMSTIVINGSTGRAAVARIAAEDQCETRLAM